KGADIGDKAISVYQIKGTENINADNNSSAINILKSRIAAVYGYRGADVVVELQSDNQIKIVIPNTSADKSSESYVDADTMISAIATKGLVEICTEQSYSKDKVVLSMENDEELFKGAKTERYVDGSNRWYIVTVDLTEKGREVANSKLTANSGTTTFCAIDEAVTSYYVMYPSQNSSYLQIQTPDITSANALASFFNHGTLKYDLTRVDFEIENNSASYTLIVGLVFAVLVIGLSVFMIVRYGLVGFAAVLSLLLLSVFTVYFAGLVYFSVFNVWAIIGFVLGLALIATMTCLPLEKVRALIKSGKSYNNALSQVYSKTWPLKLIVNGAVLLLGIILWVIPTGVTVSLGNALVYSAIASFVISFGLNRAFSLMLHPFAE
ncbi:MAG: hypothetical protein NC350_06570, partial [Corallococcus sp.]|nr:hypothetical protein [Corallococcus sp.]